MLMQYAKKMISLINFKIYNLLYSNPKSVVKYLKIGNNFLPII